MNAKTDASNTSQQHGTDFDNLMKTAHIFPGACNVNRSGNAIHDIEGSLDPVFSLATSIKATGNGTIGLADAARFYEISIHRRFLVGEWTQINERKKIFTKIHEFILPLGVLKRIRGDLSPTEVLDFHKRIASYPAGPKAAKAARGEAQWIKTEIAGRHGKVSFDFKIDDNKQRRLQLSISIQDMIDAVENEPEYVRGNQRQALHVLHDEEFCQYVLPIAILSPKRIMKPAGQSLMDGPANIDELFGILPETEGKPVDHKLATTRRMPRRQDEQAGADIFEEPSQNNLFGS